MIDPKKDKVLFIINPISGKGRALLCSDGIKDECTRRGIPFEIKQTAGKDDAYNLAKKGLEEDFTTVVAVGGDGTVNEAGKALIKSNIALGIIPAGSGNGLARHMGISMNCNKALKQVFDGDRSLIDTGIINGHIFFNIAGVGFDAHVSKAFDEMGKRGWFSYLKIIMKLSTHVPKMQFNMKHKETTHRIECMMISFANSSQYGNNARIAPMADIGDGKLDICLLAPMGFRRSLFFLIRTMLGKVNKTPFFDTFQAKSLFLKGGDGLAHVDGEPIKISDEIQIDNQPKSLYVIS